MIPIRILCVGINYWPELTGIGKYTGEMMAYLASHGHDCEVITSPPYYPAWKVSSDYRNWLYKKEKIENVTVFRCPLFVPAKPSTLTRLLHLASFTVSALPVLIWRSLRGPDVLLCIAPPFFCAPQVILLARLLRIKSWLHFQDFEICAMFGSGMMSKAQWLNGVTHWLQARITRRFDVVSTISESMCARAQNHDVSKTKIFLLPNWVDTDFVNPNVDGKVIRRKFDIDEDKIVALYSGNIGKKQGLDILIEAAKILEHRSEILFVIVGDGAHKMTLLEMVKKEQLDNILFFPLQPYELLPNLLRMADIHLVIQKKKAADAVLPSKLTSILSAGGNSIITAEMNTELGNLVRKYPGIATLIPSEDLSALVNAISTIADQTIISRDSYNHVAREYAVTQLGKNSVLKNFEEHLLSIVN